MGLSGSLSHLVAVIIRLGGKGREGSCPMESAEALPGPSRKLTGEGAVGV